MMPEAVSFVGKSGASKTTLLEKVIAELALIEKAVEKKRLRHENVLLKTRIQRQEESPEIVSRSPAMHAILATVEKVAPSDFPVLVEGGSGVGKELIARALHRASPRAEGSFIPLNCGAEALGIDPKTLCRKLAEYQGA